MSIILMIVIVHLFLPPTVASETCVPSLLFPARIETRPDFHSEED